VETGLQPIARTALEVLLPHEVYVETLLNRLYKDIRSGRTRFLIDGFPRNLEHDVLFAQYVRAPALLGAEADDALSVVMLDWLSQSGATSKQACSEWYIVGSRPAGAKTMKIWLGSGIAASNKAVPHSLKSLSAGPCYAE